MKRNILFSLLGFVIPSIVLILSYPIFVSHLGSEEFGIYTLATTLSGSLAFLGFGFFAATVKFTSQYFAKNDYRSVGHTLAAALILYFLVGSVCAITTWLLAPWLVELFHVSTAATESCSWVFRLGGLQLIAAFLINVYLAFFKGLQRFDVSAIIQCFLSVLVYGVGSAIIYVFKLSVVYISLFSLLVNVAALMVCVWVSLFICRRYGIVVDILRVELRDFKEMFGFGNMVAITSIATVFFYQMQRYLVGYFMGAGSVTIYVLAFSMASKAHALISAATEILFPFASGMRDYVKLRQLYLRMLMGSFVIAFITLLPLGVFSEVIASLWLGKENSEGVVPLLKVFSFAYFFIALSPAPYHLANGLGRVELNTANIIMRAVLNIFFLFIFWFGDGLSLVEISWAFALSALIVDGLIWLLLTEFVVWKPILNGSVYRRCGVERAP